MAKKVKKQSKKTANLPENALPQNILPVGERVEENKNIYIAQSVYKEIHRFTKNKTTNFRLITCHVFCDKHTAVIDVIG